MKNRAKLTRYLCAMLRRAANHQRPFRIRVDRATATAVGNFGSPRNQPVAVNGVDAAVRKYILGSAKAQNQTLPWALAMCLARSEGHGATATSRKETRQG